MGKKVLTIFLLFCLMFVILPVAEASFNDDLYTYDKSKNYSREIRYAYALNNLGLIQGTGSGFELDRPLTRAEAATLIVKLYKAEDEAMAKNYSHPFLDIPTWADIYVGWLFEKGIIRGVSGTHFNASTNISAEHFLMMVIRTLGYQENEAGKYTLGDGISYNLKDLAQTLGVFGSGEWEMYIGKNSNEKGGDTNQFLRKNALEICWRALHYTIDDGTLLSSILAKDFSEIKRFSLFDLTVLDENNILLSTSSEDTIALFHFQQGEIKTEFVNEMPEWNGKENWMGYVSTFDPLHYFVNPKIREESETVVTFTSPVGGLFSYNREIREFLQIFKGSVVNAFKAGEKYYVVLDTDYALSGLTYDGLTYTGNEIGIVNASGNYTCLLSSLDNHGIAIDNIWLSEDGTICFSQKSAVGQMKFENFYYELSENGITVIDFSTQDYVITPPGSEELETLTTAKIAEEQLRIDRALNK